LSVLESHKRRFDDWWNSKEIPLGASGIFYVWLTMLKR
jgi:hypothetical protein